MNDEEETVTVEDMLRAEATMLHISLTDEDVIRLAGLLPADDPLLDRIEVEMREQGWTALAVEDGLLSPDSLLAAVQDDDPA